MWASSAEINHLPGEAQPKSAAFTWMAEVGDVIFTVLLVPFEQVILNNPLDKLH